MARIRTIKPEFPQSESVGKLSREARLLFIQLWTIADDSGRARASSRMLASLLYPYDDDAKVLIDDWISELQTENMLRCYSVGGNSYLEICNWLKHQKIDKPSVSKIPAFSEDSCTLREDSRGFEEDSSTDLGPRTVDLGPRTVDLGPVPILLPAVIRLPATGGKEYAVTQPQIDRWEELYPAVDVMQALRAMVGWLEADTKRKKTTAGMNRFINSWLSKDQNRGPQKSNGGHNGQYSITDELAKSLATDKNSFGYDGRFPGSKG